MENIEELAVQTFAAAPEIYQQLFANEGAKFPDELVGAIKQDPNKAVELLNSDENLKKAVVTLFQKNKDVIMQAIQQVQKQQFGGILYGNTLQKLNKIGSKKMQYGGTVPTNEYYAFVNAPGDTTRVKPYFYSQRTMRTFPNGKILYSVANRNGTNHYWGGTGHPNFFERLWYGNKPVTAEEAQNWENIIANHPEDPRYNKLKTK